MKNMQCQNKIGKVYLDLLKRNYLARSSFNRTFFFKGGIVCFNLCSKGNGGNHYMRHRVLSYLFFKNLFREVVVTPPLFWWNYNSLVFNKSVKQLWRLRKGGIQSTRVGIFKYYWRWRYSWNLSRRFFKYVNTRIKYARFGEVSPFNPVNFRLNSFKKINV